MVWKSSEYFFLSSFKEEEEKREIKKRP